MNRKSLYTLIGISVIVGLFFFSTFNGEKNLQNALLSIGVSMLYTFPIAIGNGFLNEFLSKKYSWVEQTRERVISGIIGTVLLNAILVFGINYINYIFIQKQNPEEFFSGTMGFFNWFTLNIALLISAILHAKSFMEEWKKSTKKEIVEQKVIATSANAQFETLKNQLDPHFLFNSLNVLSALIDENPNQAQRFTASMSKIYRYVLDQKDKELVTVSEELDFAKTYCELLKTRFEDSVNFEFNVEEKELNHFVVPLSLQLLLENAIKHNFATSQKPLRIRIYSENGQLMVENNLQTREIVKERDGIGLSNIVQRYGLLTQHNVFIEKAPGFFKVKIPILTEKTSAMNSQKSQTEEQFAYEKASRRVKELKDFYGGLLAYCVVIPFLIFVNLYTSPQYHWFWWPMFGWGLGMAIHAFKVFGIGKDWEERQIKKYMEKNN